MCTELGSFSGCTFRGRKADAGVLFHSYYCDWSENYLDDRYFVLQSESYNSLHRDSHLYLRISHTRHHFNSQYSWVSIATNEPHIDVKFEKEVRQGNKMEYHGICDRFDLSIYRGDKNSEDKRNISARSSDDLFFCKLRHHIPSPDFNYHFLM
jgi:hypothetical protein